MPKKTSQKRLTIPKDIWDIVDFDGFDRRKDFGFFITDDKRVVISTVELAVECKFQYIGRCSLDDKHRFFIPSNVDTYLGNGDIYYFSTYISQHFIYLYKITPEILKNHQESNVSKLLAVL